MANRLRIRFMRNAFGEGLEGGAGGCSARLVLTSRSGGLAEAPGDNLRAALRQRIEQIGPALHHLDALREILRTVVGGAHLVALDMRQLALDHVGLEAELVQDRARRGAKA